MNEGEYYFSVVAYNKTGETMSNDVHVSISSPGSFTLDGNWGDPDTDGNFDLKWTSSEGADNYSVYRYNSTITSINGSLTLLGNQTNIIGQSIYSFPVTRLSNGKYYFAVAAYNEVGYTLSNYVDVVVQIPPDWPLIFIVSISSLVGVASIGLGWRYFRHKAEKKLKEIDKHKPSPKKNKSRIREPKK
ncbi:MAG: hypothetical protein ACFFDN_43950 [Candidatus Hodarchaeota archaeon]